MGEGKKEGKRKGRWWGGVRDGKEMRWEIGRDGRDERTDGRTDGGLKFAMRFSYLCFVSLCLCFFVYIPFDLGRVFFVHC